ncbi:hypothetical protein EDB84DRAFT_1509554 [Lactarius hengduanensis]|nr:hypothetical protein EDB84DRAFT_1509554 [Lactarius hengduanensis]
MLPRSSIFWLLQLLSSGVFTQKRLSSGFEGQTSSFAMPPTPGHSVVGATSQPFGCLGSVPYSVQFSLRVITRGWAARWGHAQWGESVAKPCGRGSRFSSDPCYEE